MAAAAPAAAPPAAAGGSHEVPGVACATAGTGSGGGAGPAAAPAAAAAADGGAASEGGAPVAPRPPPAAGAAAQLSVSPLLQQPTMKPRRDRGGPAFGSWATQQVPGQQQQQQHQQPYLPAPGGVCCIAPWASDATRTGALYPPSRGAGERGVDDSVAAAASASTAAAAAVYPDEAPLLCCEKKIRTVRDLGYWMSSSSYSHYVGFLKRLSLAVVDKKAWRIVPPLTDSGARAASGSGGIAASSTAENREAATARARSPAAGKNTSPQYSHNSGGSGSPAAQICVPLLLPEEGAFYRVENSSSKCRDSRSRRSSTTGDTVCSTAYAESEGTPQQQQQRRLSTEGLLTPPAAATASEEMVETALASGNSEAKQRAAALAAAAAQEGVHVSDAVVQLVELLQQLLLWVEDIKPVEQPMRFGNKAFRSWLQRLETCCQWLLTPLIPEMPRPAPAPLLCETIEEDPEREAAEAATSSPPPGVAAGSASVSFASAPAASSSPDSLLPPVPARLAAETLTKAPGGNHSSRGGDSSSSSSRESTSIRDTLGDGSSTYAGTAETKSGGTAAAAVAGVEEAAAAGAARSKDAAAVRSSSCSSGGDSKLTSRDPTSTEQDRDRSSSSCNSSATTQEEEQKTGEEERRVAKGRSCGEEEEEEEHAGESFVRRELLKELIDYLCHSFGDARRLDYGTGHEASFALFLLVLFESHVLREGVDDAATVLLVFTQYVEVCHALQRRYSLEPAGSRGAWGLDDFHFLPFLFGSAQLQDQLFISPAQVMEPAVVHEMAAHNLYFSSIEYIMQTKRGAPFSECAPMLYDISGISSWKKIHAGLLRMYEGEVLNKFPIAQHFLFGRYFPLNLLDASGST